MEKQTKIRPIAVDLFAGVGGMSLGFEQAGFDVLASVEMDPIHCATHHFNFPFWCIICQKIEDTTAKEIRDRSAIGDRDIDVVFGGPPCQGFSMIGKRILEDPRNALVFHYIRLVIELQPKFFVFENVKGITIGKHQKFLHEIINNFTKKGYYVQEKYQVLNACQYGVPQNRERLFLLGCRRDMQLPNYPTPINQQDKTNVWEAIQDLPVIEKYEQLSEKDWVFAEFGKPSKYGEKLRGLLENESDYSYKRNYDLRILTSSRRTRHTEESRKRFAATPPGKIEPISRFYKLDPQGICNTLRAGTASNRGAFTSPRPIHPFVPRCITVREAARLHSYPDWFRFHTTKWHGFRQVGNSVPPLLAQAVAAEIIKALNVTPYKPIETQDLGDENLLNFNMSQASQYFGVSSHVIAPRNR